MLDSGGGAAWWQDFLIGIKAPFITAGFAGGSLSLSFVKGGNFWGRVGNVVSGAITANYVTPVVQEYVGLPMTMQLGVCFLVGFTAMYLLQGIVKMAQSFATDPTAFLTRRAPAPEPPKE